MVTTPPGGCSDYQDGGSTGEEEEEEVSMGEEEVDVIRMDDNKDDDDDDVDGDVDVDVDVDVDNDNDNDNDDDDDKNSEQMVAYCKTFNLIDKGNANGGSKTHKRTTKLLFQLFNMILNNAYRMYTCLHKRHHQQEGG